MKKKYMLDVCTPPIRSTITLSDPTFPPMHVYRFSLLHHVKCLLTNPEFLVGALWKYEDKHGPGKVQIFGSLNTGDWWQVTEENLERELNKLGSRAPKTLHSILPTILFNDSTLCDNIGRLMAQPKLCTIGNITDRLCCLVKSWFVLGMVPPYPKSSKERERS